MAADVERHQAEQIEALKLKLRVEMSAMDLAQIVTEVTTDYAFVAFPLLLSLPVFAKAKFDGPDYISSLDVLRLFAYGTWNDYNSNCGSFPALLPTQKWKLKQLTVLALARSNNKLTYAQLKTALDFSDAGSLEDFLQSCNNSGIVRGNLNSQHECFEVLYTADAVQKSRGKVKGKPFDLYLEAAKNKSKGATADLLCNGIVRQVSLPQDGSNYCMAELQPKANSLFVSLLWHVTGAHFIGKSFDGQIYPGMFDVVGEQLLLPPYAAAQKKLSPGNFEKDRNVVAAILRKYTGLNISYTGRDGIKKQILYPLYMENLLDHLEGKISNLQQVHSRHPMSMARDQNYIIFILCHPTFLKFAARSVLFWYVRTYHVSSSTADQTEFESAMNKIKIKHDWYKAIQNHWLFQKVFQSGTYHNTKTDCFRFIRDWEMHVPKHLSEQQKIRYTAAVINYLAAYHFDDFLPDALYQLLCTYSKKDSKFDLKGWIKCLQQLPEEGINILTMEWDQLVLHGFPTNNVLDHQTDQIVLQLKKLRQNVKDGTSNHLALKKWRMLNILRGKSETMYYKMLIDNIDEYAPIVHIPTIRAVCQNSSGIFRSPWGMYLSAEDQGHMMSILHRSPINELCIVDLIVVTDGSSVLGFDLGTKSMGIAIGKLDLYVATAGINPHRVLPLMIDVGTNSEKLLKDPLYHRMHIHHLDEQDFGVVLDEFVSAVFTRWPKVIVQFEGFETKWAFKLLEQYKTMYRIFVDEIQGTIGVFIAGLLRVVAAQGKQLSEFPQQRILVAGVDRMPSTEFRVPPPPEDPSPGPDPNAAFHSLVRVISEFGFVSSIIAGICIQRNGVIHQTSMAADITKLLVLVAGTAAFGANIQWIN
ncbi:unnamed protein product [Urochloa humidicola]